MYKYNIIEQFIEQIPFFSNDLSFRYSSDFVLRPSVLKILSYFQERKNSINYKLFLYITIEDNIFIKI